MKLLGVWGRFFRIRLLPTALCNGTTGAVASGALDSPPDFAHVLLAAVVVSGLYLVGMGSNDLVDRERDRTVAPQRPLPSGELPLRSGVTAVAIVGVTAVAAASFLPARTLPWSGAAALTIFLYNGVFKQHPWLGPLSMGAVRAAVVLFGAALIRDASAGALPAVVLGGHGFWVTRYSLEEERARPHVLRRRARGVLLHSLAGLLLTQFILAPPPWRIAGWIAPLCALAAAKYAARQGSPGHFTFRALLVLYLVDGSLQLAYNSPITAAVCGVLYLLTFPSLRRERRRL